MPATIPTPTDLSAMAFLSWAAYDEGGASAVARLDGSGWQVLDFADLGAYGNGLLEPSDFVEGFYEHGASAALVVERDGVIAIAIRGSENLWFGGTLDFFAAAFDQQSHFTDLQPLLNAVIAYIDNREPGAISQLYVTGHSLGGIMAELFALDYAAQALALGIDVSVATFGSPGTEQSTGGNALTDVIVHVGHRSDQVFNQDLTATADFTRRGAFEIAINIPDEAPSGGLDFVEHMPALYQRSVDMLVRSTFFQQYLDEGLGRTLYVDAHWPEASDSLRYLSIVSTTGAPTLAVVGDGDDAVVGSSASDWIDGGEGVDSLDGAVGDDVIRAGIGNDFLTGGVLRAADLLFNFTDDDILTGGTGGDVYLFGSAISPVNSAWGYGHDVILDQGGGASVDAVAIFGGDVVTSLSQIGWAISGANLDVTVNNGEGDALFSFTIQSFDTEAGHIEELRLFVGNADQPLTIALPGLTSPPPSSFSDDFNRADGVIGNGWQVIGEAVGAEQSIVNNVLAAGLAGASAAFRPFDFSDGITLITTLTQTNGFGGLPFRYGTSFVVGNDGDLSSGYGVTISRGDINYADSAVSLIRDGVTLASIASTFQFGAAIEISLSIAPDGSVSGVIRGDGNVFSFGFDARAMGVSGGNFAIIQYPPDPRTSSPVPSTVDNVLLLNSTAVFDDYAIASPATDVALPIGSTIVGNIETPLDRDWFEVNLAEGVAYFFQLNGADSGQGTLADPFMRVRDAAGLSLASNEDAGAGTHDSSIVFIAPYTGTFFVSVGGDLLSDGTYRLHSANVGSAEALTLQGDGGANYLTGLGGSDTLRGFEGNDTLIGGGGADLLIGYQDDDTLIGGDGDDRLAGAATTPGWFGVQDIDWIDGGAGWDEAWIDLTFISQDIHYQIGDARSVTGVTFVNGSHVRNVEYFHLFGGAGDDVVSGGAALLSNWMEFYGGAGADQVLLDLSSISQAVVLESNGPPGWFAVSAGSFNAGLPAGSYPYGGIAFSGVETFQIFTGQANDRLDATGAGGAVELRGGDGDDAVTGGNANDALFGEGGNDILDGGGGADALAGGGGDDTYLINDSGDSISEGSNQGVDSVRAAVSFTLGANLERLVLVGEGATSGTGNALANTITGNSANNVLDGGAGADTMIGRDGDDTYLVDDASDVVTENASEGTDTVQSAINYTLGVNVENLVLTSGAAINGNGNGLANVVTGNSANNILDGGLGLDTMIGGVGDDTYLVDNGGDVVTENASEGTDTIRSTVGVAALAANVENLVLLASAVTGNGNGLNNIITGNASNNSINGGAGADTMIGGLGNDTYFIDNVGDVVTELAGQGTDTVFSTVNVTALWQNVENLTLSATALSANGNFLNNIITGNSQKNTLNGGAGEDTLIGGLDSDTYIYNSLGDVITENLNEGLNDAVIAFIDVAALMANVENVTLAGTAISATGNDLNNIITGNSLNNFLYGGLGNDQLNGAVGADTMTGGQGDDTYLVENLGDVVIEASGEGNDVIYTWVNIAALTDNVERATIIGPGNLNITGNALNNRLNGNDNNNTLVGLDGEDIIGGLAGADVIIGGAGRDLLTGGAGADTFVYQALSDSGVTGSSRDIIYDFVQGQDLIDLVAIDAISGGGDDAFNFIGNTAFSNTAGELRYEVSGGYTIISMDINGDGIADSQITLVGNVPLTSADFGL